MITDYSKENPQMRIRNVTRAIASHVEALEYENRYLRLALKALVPALEAAIEVLTDGNNTKFTYRITAQYDRVVANGNNLVRYYQGVGQDIEPASGEIQYHIAVFHRSDRTAIASLQPSRQAAEDWVLETANADAMVYETDEPPFTSYSNIVEVQAAESVEFTAVIVSIPMGGEDEV